MVLSDSDTFCSISTQTGGNLVAWRLGRCILCKHQLAAARLALIIDFSLGSRGVQLMMGSGYNIYAMGLSCMHLYLLHADSDDAAWPWLFIRLGSETLLSLSLSTRSAASALLTGFSNLLCTTRVYFFTTHCHGEVRNTADLMM